VTTMTGIRVLRHGILAVMASVAGMASSDASRVKIANIDFSRGSPVWAIANLAEALEAAGSGLSGVLKTTVYVASADRGDLVTAWDVIRAAFAHHDPPSTLLGVAVLGYPGQLVEIEAVAVS
jgi:enamine deaminase RidA (YjgF/YER057c/UK114 family)